ncbi:MAG: GHMP kinase [Rhodospirillaceae bacterium]|jgi:D-glycero-alpha-D-manno-heptose-7-phosphate kinase|nr:GHMP kinase [Rhodospirillaceae bacterium]MBT4220481.1 GHMP kinase [Rhodospirillaceae bacterium]MBT4464429.1 GHMP kinase [Rhodospirillaceae bacterium]MBT5308566.1 GHMP kinase [Rhodospirillaceae bacterium]MBT7356849.1 GHMP kinase [Rhodospirillaceae bacterium]
MIGVRTPFRVGLVGGGSDMRKFYLKHPGCVVSTSINKYMHVIVHKSFDDKIHLKYGQIESTMSIDKIEHPLIRSVLEKFNLTGVDITSVADVPPGTGLGSSSSFMVSILHAIYAYVGETVSKERLAREACDIEIDLLDGPLGKQDQYAAAYGGLNRITFHSDEKVTVEPLDLSPTAYRDLEESLVMFYIGGERDARIVLADQQKNFSEDEEKFQDMVKLTELANDFCNSLVAGNIQDCGEILHQGWLLKRRQSQQISSPSIDRHYDLAMKCGAWGGKLLGAGGGGFMAFLCPPEKQDDLHSALSDLRPFPVRFENQGTTLLFEDE